jgi:hypothetical protein
MPRGSVFPLVSDKKWSLKNLPPASHNSHSTIGTGLGDGTPARPAGLPLHTRMFIGLAAGVRA